MGFMDLFKKKTSSSVILIERADFSSENPMGPFIAIVEGGQGLIKKDGSVDMANLVNMLSKVIAKDTSGKAQKDFFVWCGTSGTKEGEPWAAFYDLIKVKDLDLRSGKLGFAHEDFRKLSEGRSGISFDEKVKQMVFTLDYTWL